MVFYLEKAEEYREVAEECYEIDRYNTAAGRYYYSLYLRGKALLIEREFDYELFLRDILKIRDWKHKRHLYSHGTICRALTIFLFSWNTKNSSQLVEDFSRAWEFLFNLRVRADYINEKIIEKEIQDCRKMFYTFKEVIENG